MLSLRIKRRNIRCLCVTLSSESCILRLRLVKISLSIDTHNGDLLIGVDEQLLSIGSGIVDLGDGLGFDLIDDDLLLALGLSDEDGSFLFCFGLGDLLLGVGSEFLLLLVDLGSCD